LGPNEDRAVQPRPDHSRRGRGGPLSAARPAIHEDRDVTPCSGSVSRSSWPRSLASRSGPRTWR